MEGWALSEPARTDLRFALLGPVRAWRDGEAIELGSPQQRAVLATLLLHKGRAVTAGGLVDALWGTEPPHRAVAALRTYVSRLRPVLEPDRRFRTAGEVLVSVADGYALRLPAGSVDLDMFEWRVAAAEEARREGDKARAHDLLSEGLALWEGVPLYGVPGPYAEVQRRRLLDLRLDAQETALDLALELGRHAEAIGELTALAAEHPLRERPYTLLMLALYRAGRQAEALAVYADLRRILVDELGIEPGPEVAALHQRILTADPALAAPPAETPAVTLVSPAQLPADIADFTGRALQLARLRDVLRGASSAMPVAVVTGSAGVGKTALAVHAAHDLRADFPDGQLYVDLRGSDARPAEPGEVLLSFLRALGVQAAVPDAVEHRAALFRSAVSGRRLLVVLDNARDATQVGPLLPGGPGCAVLITSRTAMAEPAGAQFVDLGVPGADEALELFAKVAGSERVAAEPFAAHDVVAACGFLPLAVRIVAARLSTRPSWTVAALAVRLGDERRRLDELKIGNLAVESSFQLSYAQLRGDQSRAFRLLAVPDVPELTAPIAAALLDTDEPRAEVLCESLVDACLLDSPVPGRYRFHDLVRLYARRQAKPGERTGALTRLLDHYTETVGLLLPPHRSERHARQRLNEERTGLFSAVYQAALEPDGPVAPATYLVLALCEVVDADGARGDAEWAMAALMGATLTGGQGLRRLPRGRLSAPLLPRGSAGQLRPVADLDRLDHACTLLEQTGEPRPMAWAAFLRGTASLLAGDAEAAVRQHLRSIESLPAGGDGMLYALMIKVYRDAGSFAAGTAIAERALAMARGGGDRATEAFTLHELGLLTMLAGEPERGVAQCRAALALARGTGRRIREGYALLRLAQTLLGLEGQAATTEAVETAERAVAALGEAADPSQRAVALAVLAEALATQGDQERSAGHYREAAEVFTSLGLPSAL